MKYYDWNIHEWLIDLADAKLALKLGHSVDAYSEEKFKNRFKLR